MKKKDWIINIVLALLAAVCFVYLYKCETDSLGVIFHYYGMSYKNGLRYLFKVLAYGLSYLVIANISYACLKEKSSRFKCIVMFVTSFVLLFVVLFVESFMEWATWEYLFEPAAGYTVWFVLKGEVMYTVTHWLAALRYMLAFVAYPFIYVFTDLEWLCKIYLRIKDWRIAYHQRALAHLQDDEFVEETISVAIDTTVIDAKDIRKILDKIAADKELLGEILEKEIVEAHEEVPEETTENN